MRLGTETLGPPDQDTMAKLEGIESREVLEELVMRVVKAKSWAEVLAGV